MGHDLPWKESRGYPCQKVLISAHIVPILIFVIEADGVHFEIKIGKLGKLSIIIILLLLILIDLDIHGYSLLSSVIKLCALSRVMET